MNGEPEGKGTPNNLIPNPFALLDKATGHTGTTNMKNELINYKRRQKLIMSDKIDYYYSRRRDNHYNTPFQIMMENKPKGYKYLNLLDKLIQLSLVGKGRLVLPDGQPYDCEMLSALTRHDIDTIREGLEIFKANKLIDVLPNGTIYVLNIHDMIGKSSTEADRKRKYRMRIDAEREGRPYVDSDGLKESDECPPETEPNNNQNQNQNQNEKHNIYTRNQRQSVEYSPSYSDAFEQLWDMYPRKEGKQEAFQAYLAAQEEGVSDEIIADGIERYNEHINNSATDEKFIVTGINWFRQRRWDDKYLS